MAVWDLQTCRKLPGESKMKHRYWCWYGKQLLEIKAFSITELCKFYQEQCRASSLILLLQEPVVIVLIVSVSKCCINQITLASTVELFIISGRWLWVTSYTFTMLHWYCITCFMFIGRKAFYSYPKTAELVCKIILQETVYKVSNQKILWKHCILWESSNQCNYLWAMN